MTTEKQAKLKNLLFQLDNLGKKKLEVKNQSFQIVPPDFFDNLNAQLDKFKGELNLQPIIDSIKTLEQSINDSEKGLRDELQTKIDSLPKPPDLSSNVARLQIDFENKLKTLGIETANNVQSIKQQFTTFIEAHDKQDALEKENLDKRFLAVNTELNKRLSQLGGGSMNRQEKFNGTDRLTRYTDINWKAGNNVTFTIVNNDTFKRVDVTISATGGSGSGIVRSINSVSVPTTAGSASTTDYVYLVSGTTTITLPDATAGNTNLYTIKNVGTGVVTVNTTSSQTIDGSLTITLPVQYTSVDIESDSANWNIT